ncbi:hypothetical protein CENSYa_1624 [Cenarchaeum symbiosum A]|uniref:Uncharacterized protein n=1 Tax=Cenarchaeum symbiosum (strain A) TaxID=414004 RepID=A0RY25_CENSY|nr:hypothetical protein CENSYa_1624 [Cenarchaeum symbiosum A]
MRRPAGGFRQGACRRFITLLVALMSVNAKSWWILMGIVAVGMYIASYNLLPFH